MLTSLKEQYFQINLVVMGETVAVYEDDSPALYYILAGNEIIGQFDGQDRRYHVKDHFRVRSDDHQ